MILAEAPFKDDGQSEDRTWSKAGLEFARAANLEGAEVAPEAFASRWCTSYGAVSA